MNQQELESRAIEIFERQGFRVREESDRFIAEKNAETKQLQVFSSEEYHIGAVNRNIEEGTILFVDEGLEELQETVENQVSVIREQEDINLETPSYEMIGDIAVINELPDMSEKDAVEAIRHYEKSVKTILLKENGLSGEFRVGDYRKIYGEETETVHKEFGCRFKVDPTKVYYSERFSTERNRVVSQIEEGEKVLVMFAGVGPYAIMAARNANPDKVVAVEKNPEACKFLKENIELNSVGDIVEARCGDVKDILPDLGQFDRIVMPLPGSADEFLSLAFSRIGEKGIIHYYRFESQSDEIFQEIKAASGNRAFSVLERTVCGKKAPGVERVCYDVMIDQ